jgi:hypothetical protein
VAERSQRGCLKENLFGSAGINRHGVENERVLH